MNIDKTHWRVGLIDSRGIADDPIFFGRAQAIEYALGQSHNSNGVWTISEGSSDGESDVIYLVYQSVLYKTVEE